MPADSQQPHEGNRDVSLPPSVGPAELPIDSDTAVVRVLLLPRRRRRRQLPLLLLLWLRLQWQRHAVLVKEQQPRALGGEQLRVLRRQRRVRRVEALEELAQAQLQPVV